MKWFQSKWRVLARVLVLVAILAAIVVPVASAYDGATPGVPNLFGMTLRDFLAWLISEAVLGAFVAYLLGQFNVPDALRVPLVAVALAVASAIVNSLTPFIPPQILDAKLWDLLFLLIGALPGWIGLRAGALLHAAQVRAAGYVPKHVTMKLAGL